MRGSGWLIMTITMIMSVVITVITDDDITAAGSPVMIIIITTTAARMRSVFCRLTINIWRESQKCFFII